jgi:hypothetical protein
MLGEGGTQDLLELESAVARFRARDDRRVDPRRLQAVIDSLEGEFAEEALNSRRSCEHLADGSASAISRLGQACGMSPGSVADRMCVAEQLESLPKVAEALHSGELGYQSVSILCHLRAQLGDKKDLFNEEEMLEDACRLTVKELRFLCRYARHIADPDGFFDDAEADFEDRSLHISQLPNGMHAIDGVLDAVGGAALKTALESLARRLGPEDVRKHKQRMADALVELTNHALDQGRLPRRGSVRPHLTVTTTLEGLKNEVGAPPAEVQHTLPTPPRATTARGPRQEGAHRLRQHHLPGPAGGVHGGRCGPGDANGLRSNTAGAARSRQALLLAGLRPADQLDQPAPHRVRQSRRLHQPAQPGLALLLPPPAGA